MAKYNDVKEIRYSYKAEELTITVNTGTPPPLLSTRGGRKFKMEKEDGKWNLEITADIIQSGEIFEINTVIEESDIDFKTFNSKSKKPVMEFIGIDDIRDGVRPRIEIAYGKSFVSIETTSTGRLIIRKAPNPKA